MDNDPLVYKELEELENDFAAADDQLLRQAIKLFTPLYEKRDPLVRKIDKFWLTVLEENETVSEQINLEDTKLFDHFVALKVTHPNPEQARDFTIQFEFTKNEFLDDSNLILSKDFTPSCGQGGPRDEYSSTPVPIKWKSNLTATSNTRPSFFTFFAWTGLTDSTDEFEFGEEIALTLKDEVYPDALLIWTTAQTVQDDLDGASDDGSADIQSGEEGIEEEDGDEEDPGVDEAVPGVDEAVPGVDEAVPGMDEANSGVDEAEMEDYEAGSQKKTKTT